MSLFNNIEKPIGIASDRTGFKAKQYILGVLKEKGIHVRILVPIPKRVPIRGFASVGVVCRKGECYPGIAICGSSNGINMTVNNTRNTGRPLLDARPGFLSAFP